MVAAPDTVVKPFYARILGRCYRGYVEEIDSVIKPE